MGVTCWAFINRPFGTESLSPTYMQHRGLVPLAIDKRPAGGGQLPHSHLRLSIRTRLSAIGHYPPHVHFAAPRSLTNLP